MLQDVQPQWLDERTARAWRGFHQMRIQLIAHLGREVYRESGLTEADYAVLIHTSEAPGRRVRSRELGRALGWDRSRLSHQITRMEGRGTVTRAPSEGDARGFDVVLTDAGIRAIEAAAPRHLEAVRHCFADLLSAKQLDTLAEIADIITTHLAEEHPDTAA